MQGFENSGTPIKVMNVFYEHTQLAVVGMKNIQRFIPLWQKNTLNNIIKTLPKI